ncbi:MAG TPA: flagellar basal body rod protein FlgC [Ruminococcaceae bacterium]|jgi:flagellar basal-body rod protein FlgC|nr:flagellar basal body rod protein FlgC [Oscillospiraceae bacterium]
MAFLHSLDISGSGLTASRLRMDLISENIANAETTRTEHGGPYRRKMAVYQCADSNGSFRSMLDSQAAKSSGNMPLNGVKVSSIKEDKTPFPVEYDPSSPDADARGYVQKPNVDLIKETTDMMAVTRAYNANMTAFDSVKDMAAKAIEIGK